MNRFLILSLLILFCSCNISSTFATVTKLEADTCSAKLETNGNKNTVDSKGNISSENEPLLANNSEPETKKENSGDSALFTAILTIVSVIIGILIEKGIESWNEKKRMEKSGKRWVSEIQLLENTFDLQKQALIQYKDELSDDVFNCPNPHLYSALNGEAFKQLNKSDLIEYIRYKNKKLDDNKIIQISTYVNGYANKITSIYEDIIKKFNLFVDKSSSYTDSFSRNMQKFNNAFAHFSVKLEVKLGIADITVNPIFQPLYELYMEHFAPHLEDSQFDPFKLEIHFFIPMMNYMAENYRSDLDAIPLTDAMTGCLIDIKALKLERRYMKDNINQTVNFYQELQEELPNIVLSINNYNELNSQNNN